MPTFNIIDDDIVNMRIVFKHRRHPGFGKKADPGKWKILLMARTAGVVITASPIQLVDRTSSRFVFFILIGFIVYVFLPVTIH